MRNYYQKRVTTTICKSMEMRKRKKKRNRCLHNKREIFRTINIYLGKMNMTAKKKRAHY